MEINSYYTIAYRHFMAHHIKEPCALCGEMIGSAVMNVHLQFKHDINKPEKNLKCQYCAKAFRSSGSLLDHENTHTGARPHMCKNCGKCFANSGSYSNHMKHCIRIKVLPLTAP